MDNINNLRHDKKFTDVIIEIDGTEFHCHQLILAASFTFFDKEFKKWKNSPNSIDGEVLRLSFNIPKNGFENLLTFAYTEKIFCTADNCMDIYIAASYFGLNRMLSAFEQVIESFIDPITVLKYRNFAEKYCLENILKLCQQFIIHNLSDISYARDFLNLKCDELSLLIRSLNLSDNMIEINEHLFWAILKWITWNFDERKQYFYELLRILPINHLKFEFMLCSVMTTSFLEFTFDAQKLIKDRISSIENHLNQSGYILFAFCWNRNISYPKHWKYYSSIQTWIPITGEQPKQINIFTCLLIYGSIVLFGDREIEVLDPKTMKFLTISPMQREHFGAAVTSYDRFFFVAGGGPEETAIALQHFHKYDFTTRIWTELKEMIIPRRRFSLIFFNNSLYAFGGGTQDIEKYDFETNTWNIVGRIPLDGLTIQALALNDMIYALDCNGHFGTFDSQHKWTELLPFPETLREFVCAIKDNKFHVYFCNDNNRAYEFDAGIKIWRTFSMRGLPQNCNIVYFPLPLIKL